MALFVVLFAVFLLSIMIIGLWTQFFADLKQTSRIQDDAFHFYVAEAILSKGINRMKKKPWHQRWANPDPDALFSEADGGTYQGAQWQMLIADVARFDGKPLTGVVDFFVRITHNSTVRRYFLRAEMREANPLQPTQIRERRLARVTEDFEKPAGRADLLARIEDEGRQSEANRPATRVYARMAKRLAGAGMPVGEVAAALRSMPRRPAPEPLWSRVLAALARELRPRSAYARVGQEEALRERLRRQTEVLTREAVYRSRNAVAPDVIAAQLRAGFPQDVAQEKIRLARIWSGDRLLFATPQVPATLPVALRFYTEALAAAEAQNRDSQQPESVPPCLYRLAQTCVAIGRAKPCEDPTRAADLRRAVEFYDRIRRDFPDSIEAPHAYIPRAWLELYQVCPVEAAAWNAARLRAFAILKELRERYPEYRLWDEEAITGTVHPGETLPSDEVVWYVERLMEPMVRHGQRVPRTTEGPEPPRGREGAEELRPRDAQAVRAGGAGARAALARQHAERPRVRRDR